MARLPRTTESPVRNSVVRGLPASYRKFSCSIIPILVLLCACSAPTAEITPGDDGEKLKSVVIVHDRWHAAIVVKKADFPATVIPEARDFPGAEYLEFSWGDRDYFPAPDPGLGAVLKAAFWSSGSILHVIGFHGATENYPTGAEILEVNLTKEGFERLLHFISNTFSRRGPSEPADAQPGLYSNSRFYAATGKFSVFRNCNTWVAEALSAGGLSISPGYVVTAGDLGDQVRALDTPK